MSERNSELARISKQLLAIAESGQKTLSEFNGWMKLYVAVANLFAEAVDKFGALDAPEHGLVNGLLKAIDRSGEWGRWQLPYMQEAIHGIVSGCTWDQCNDPVFAAKALGDFLLMTIPTTPANEENTGSVTAARGIDSLDPTHTSKRLGITIGQVYKLIGKKNGLERASGTGRIMVTRKSVEARETFLGKRRTGNKSRHLATIKAKASANIKAMFGNTNAWEKKR